MSDGTPHHYSSMESFEKAVSFCTSTSQREEDEGEENEGTDQVIYDTLAPPSPPPPLPLSRGIATTAAASLPPPSPRVPPRIEHRNHSTSELGKVTDFVIRGTSLVGSARHLSESLSARRRANSVPEIVEEMTTDVPDFPVGGSKPVSIARDLLELDGYIAMQTVEKAGPVPPAGPAWVGGARGLSQGSNGHVIRMHDHITRLPTYDFDSDIDDSDI